jgi:hypothetical protein
VADLRSLAAARDRPHRPLLDRTPLSLIGCGRRARHTGNLLGRLFGVSLPAASERGAELLRGPRSCLRIESIRALSAT